MPARESEALVLRTYPYREADSIVSFLARDQGKLRGIAKAARRPKSRFGSGLERLAHVRLFYFQKESVELVRLDRSELLDPPLLLRADYAASIALDYVAEITDRMLPEHEPNDPYFRLLLLVLGEIGRGITEGEANGGPARMWRALTYFALWSVRLGGWLPPMNVCLRSSEELAPGEEAYFERGEAGLFSKQFRGPNSWPIAAESRTIAGEMLKKSLTDLSERAWTRETAADLRHFLEQRLEEQFEHRLKTASMLAEFS